jgi:hypothetical protein
MPLAYSENYFHNSILCKDSPNIYTHCEHSFSINARTKCLVTTFDEGHLAIAYTSIPKDEDGNWLIVDVETVKKAVETHCLKRYWQLRMNMREDGAIGMYKNYSSEYEFLAPKATAELMMPDFFEYQNIRNMNKFIKEDYPTLNRKERKANECKRLSTISYKSKSVKYADLIDNTSSIAKYDKDFAEVYLKEKEEILKVMNNGNQALFLLCKEVLSESINNLN